MFQNSRAISAINALNVSSASMQTSYINYTDSNFAEFANIQSAIANESKFGGEGTDPNVDAALYSAANSEPLYIDENNGRQYFSKPGVGNTTYDYEKNWGEAFSLNYIC